MSTVTPVVGEVPTVLPDLQERTAAHIPAHTQPTGTQPTQLGHTTGAGLTALVNAPETHTLPHSPILSDTLRYSPTPFHTLRHSPTLSHSLSHSHTLSDPWCHFAIQHSVH